MNNKKFIPKLISFKKFYNHKTGYLIPFYKKNKKINLNCLPLKIERFFFSTSNKNSSRGDHAHLFCSQFLICISGSLKIETVFSLKKKKTFYISEKKSFGLLLPPLVWSKIIFLKKSFLFVVCDYKYDKKKEYINSFKKFIKISEKYFK
jgi:dTDP-4-dehydrorhamnose 3,5-epimerase-like enzyme